MQLFCQCWMSVQILPAIIVFYNVPGVNKRICLRSKGSFYLWDVGGVGFVWERFFFQQIYICIRSGLYAFKPLLLWSGSRGATWSETNYTMYSNWDRGRNRSTFWDNLWTKSALFTVSFCWCKNGRIFTVCYNPHFIKRSLYQFPAIINKIQSLLYVPRWHRPFHFTPFADPFPYGEINCTLPVH